MKKFIKRVVNGCLSIMTTCLIMASPVAAMVYITEPETAVESFSLHEEAAPVAVYIEEKPPAPEHETEPDIVPQEPKPAKTRVAHSLTERK